MTMTMTEVFQIMVAQVIGTIIAGIGVYAAIRADLAQLNARVKHAEEAVTRLTTRVDDIFNVHFDRRRIGSD